MSNKEIKKALDKNEGHDREAHDYKSARQTGFVDNCERCKLLKLYNPKLAELEKAKDE